MVKSDQNENLNTRILEYFIMLHFFQAAKPTALGILRRGVAARLAYLRQHLRRHPVLERLRLRQLRREHQGVETAFVDEDSLLFASHVVKGGVTFR